jgi:hypothetical protein
MFTLDQIVPWGRSFDEYRRMFALSDADLERSILGCADGPASFNVTATGRGANVVSCDPLYQFDAAQIRARIDATYAEIQKQTRQNATDFVWDMIRDPEELGRIRMSAMEAFLRDFAGGGKHGRYVGAALPQLPFAEQSFDLGLCSHFLFLYSAHLDAAFHRDALEEMCRVAAELRIFPVLNIDGRRSPHVADLVEELVRDGFIVTIERVPYEFQRGGNEMLRVRRPDV